jgi:hypothetical protein
VTDKKEEGKYLGASKIKKEQESYKSAFTEYLFNAWMGRGLTFIVSTTNFEKREKPFFMAGT